MSSAYEVVKYVVDELEDFKDLKQRLRSHAIDIAPDYPDVENADHWQHIWAIASAAQGLKLACDDLRKQLFTLERFVENTLV